MLCYFNILDRIDVSEISVHILKNDAKIVFILSLYFASTSKHSNSRVFLGKS